MLEICHGVGNYSLSEQRAAYIVEGCHSGLMHQATKASSSLKRIQEDVDQPQSAFSLRVLRSVAQSKP